MYKYETHLHTYPVSKCARATVRETLEFYKGLGYDGVFITNHFLDGNINIDHSLPYEEKIKFYCSDYEEGKRIADEIGIKVFFGIEMSYKGTDFLVYGLDEKWLLENPQIMDMKKSEELPFLAEAGALIVQAHPYREARYIDHIRLFPRCVHGVEVINAKRTPLENDMAAHYAKCYGLFDFAGSDNHVGPADTRLAGIDTERPLNGVADLIEVIRNGEYKIFYTELQ